MDGLELGCVQGLKTTPWDGLGAWGGAWVVDNMWGGWHASGATCRAFTSPLPTGVHEALVGGEEGLGQASNDRWPKGRKQWPARLEWEKRQFASHLVGKNFL